MCYLFLLLLLPQQETPPYRPGPGDVLTIHVYGQENLSGDYVVTEERSLILPLVGELPLEGDTLLGIKARLTELLEQDYLKSPLVSVAVKTYGSRSVKVIGDVGRPGLYYLRRDTRLFDILTEAGILESPGADIQAERDIHLIRRKPNADTDDSLENRKIPLADLLLRGDASANLVLQHGDVIYVPEPGYVYVLGEVRQPGRLAYEENMPVWRAIFMAGGTTREASNKIWLHREEQGQKKRIKISPETKLSAGDIIEIPRSFW